MKLAAVLKVDPGAKGPPAARKLQTYLLDRLGSDLHSIRIAEARLLPVACLDAAEEKPDALVVVGGHGTARTAGEIAYRHGMPVAFLPGSGPNVLARRSWGAMNAEAIVDALAGHSFKSVRFDVGCAGGRIFFISAACGIVPHLAVIRQELRQARSSGLTLQALLRVSRLAQLSMHPYIRVDDGGHGFMTAGLVAALHTPRNRAPPQGFDCRALENNSRSATAALALRAFMGSDWKPDATKAFSAPRLRVESGRHVWMLIDDTPLRLPAPLSVEILPETIEAIGLCQARGVNGKNSGVHTRSPRLVTS